MNEEILQKIVNLSEEFFDLTKDPRQVSLTKESFQKFHLLHPKTIIYRLDNGDPMSWIFVIPTSQVLMERFLEGEITERDLLELSEPNDSYDALYLCSAFTVPKHRRKGYVVGLAKEAIDHIPHTEDAHFFAWPISSEGEQIIKKLEKILGISIKIKK
jgi:hypothetical protein